ncbi:hypothetical protein [Parabacteroides faecis]|uniref:BRCT domain-containing protein n=1 Tax=Parabacteroides faecis TaxID=1217282 RepID=A0ABR6KR31_9BACT|nr:hypothetical protein [Parabacteroides faecis]MBB4623970.1 hypothetical protein [Parabacteroides faecis]GGK07449.1 hypothetical protein GCM10007084_33220 [Parabacteroides faecis]
MKYFEPNVVIVDDKEDEVSGLIEYYQKSGAGCKFFNANLYDGDDRPEKKMSDVILLYLDLYYKEGIDLDYELPADWVRDIIPPKSFYILILWTKDPSQASGVLRELEKYNTKPYQVFIENKGNYINKSTGKYDYSKLIDSIENKLSDIPAFDEIQIWKNNIKKTSNIVLGGLVSEDVNESTNKIRKIIVSHGGEVVKNSESLLKRSVLFEALNNVLVSSIPQYDSENNISKEDEANLYDLSKINTVHVDRRLNSWFHFTLRDDLKDKLFPGIIARNDSAFLQKYYSIQDDVIVNNLLKYQLDSESTKIEDIVLNITRPCDYAQNKYGKNIKLLSGVRIIKPARKDSDKCEIRLNGKTPDCIKKFDHLFHDDVENDITLIFDFRYVFSLPGTVFLSEFYNLKMLNKELLSEIQFSYSSYASRPGFTKIF